MTSSQEPPLTRREMRERERLLEQQAASSTPDAATPPAPQPAQPTPPAPAQPPVPAAQPQAPAPRPAGAAADASSPFGGAIVSPTPGAPAPGGGYAPPFDPTASAPARPAPLPEPTTPERTLTRRELRAMLDAHAAGEFHDLDFVDELEAESREASGDPAPAAPAAPAPGAGSSPFAPPSVPARAPAPHQVADAAIAEEPAAASRPVGHWTSQLDAPIERAEPFDQLLSRGGVSHGVPTTTNALILPTLPDQGPMSDALAKSGEVIVTGSVDLPRSFGATGVHPSQIDSSDVDRLFDQVEDGASVGAPVAAKRAISTQNNARTMMAPPKKEGMNVPLVLAVTAGVLALGVVATLVIGAVAGLF